MAILAFSSNNIFDSTSAGRALLTAADASAQRSLLGLGTADIASFSGLLVGDGALATPSIAFSGETTTGIYRPSSATISFVTSNGETARVESSLGFGLRSGALLWWGSSVSGAYSQRDTILLRDAANTLAQRNGVNAQAFRVYNTYTDASNYERGKLAWSSNVLQIGTEKLGTGVARQLDLQTDGTTRLRVDSNGEFYLGSSATTTLRVYNQISGSSSYEQNTQGIAFDMRSISGTTTTTGAWFYSSNTATAANHFLMRLSPSFAPTSGTATYSYLALGGSINQTGGASGVTRGVYVNPTLTATADWRSIETSNNTGWAFYGAGTANSYFGGGVRVVGAYYDSSNSAGSSGQVLASTGTGTDWVSLSEISGVDGSGTLNYVTKWTPDGNTIGNSQIFDDGTNVGLNTSSPNFSLEICKSNYPILSLRNSDSSSSGVAIGTVLGELAFAGTDLVTDVNARVAASIRGIGEASWTTTSSTQKAGLGFFTQSDSTTGKVERVRIANSGDVGIGTTAPANRLHVYNSSNSVASFESAGSPTVDIFRTSLTGIRLQAIGGSSQSVIGSTAGGRSITLCHDASGGSITNGVGIGNTPVITDIRATLSVRSATTAARTVSIEKLASQTADLFVVSSDAAAYPDTTNIGNFFKIAADGKIGIGTTSLTRHLNVEGGDGIRSNPASSNLFSTAGWKRALEITKDSAILTSLGGTTYSISQSGNNFYIGYSSANDASAAIAYRLFIDSSGNVGVGTTSPSALLSVGASNNFTVDSSGNVNLVSPANIQVNRTNDVVGNTAINFANQFGLQVTATAGDFQINRRAGGFWFNTLTVLNTNGAVGIGTTSPTVALHVSGGGNESILAENTTSNETQIGIKSPTRRFHLVVAGASPTVGLQASTFAIRDYTQGANRLVIDTSGNVGIGTTSPSSRLHVKGSGTTSATFGINLEDSAGTHVFRVRDDGGIHVGPTTGSTTGAFISASDGTDNIGTTTNSGLRYRSSLTLSTTGADHYFRNYQGSRSHTSGNAHLMQCVGGYAPTSGTGVYNLMTLMPTVNQTGGATGITRGLYIEAVLTAADDYRAIDTNNGVWRLNDTYGAGSGSLARPALTINQTWNTTGIPTAFQVNVTDTASNASSLLMDLRVGGTSRIAITKSGNVINSASEHLSTYDCSTSSANGVSERFYRYGGNNGAGSAVLDVAYLGGTVAAPTNPVNGRYVQSLCFRTGGTNNTLFSNPSFAIRHTISGAPGSSLSPVDTSFFVTSTADGIPTAALELLGQSASVRIPLSLRIGASGSESYLYPDAANILAQRNGVNAQAFRLYNTYTDASNYERGKIAWESNALRIGTEKLGTGTARQLDLQTDGTTRISIAGNGTISTNNAINVVNSAIVQIAQVAVSGSGTQYVFDAGTTAYSGASGATTLFAARSGFTPTSGTMTYSGFAFLGTINQTGGANGITRGLYIAPTLTSAADFRAIEVTSGGAYINTSSVDSSAILQADSTTKGFLPPRMTQAQRTAISSPAVGLMVYQTDGTEGLYVNTSSGWKSIAMV